MKLNYKRTILIGLAFLSICAFWQLYDTIIPLILRDVYQVKDGPAGVIMALDNVVALFLLPLFGALSDKKGARMPFIIAGTIAAVCIMLLLPVIANAHMAGKIATGFPQFVIVLGILLLVMGSYRSPAVALMADVTPKPLRSQGNAIINLMGAVGGLFTLVMIKVAVFPGEHGGENYFYLFLCVAAFMAVAVAVLFATTREKKLVQAMKNINYGVNADEDQSKTVEINGKTELPPDVRRSLLLILACIALWFMGYNAVVSAFSKYATAMWSGGLGRASTCLMVATVAAVVSYVPVGVISARLGRKKTIVLGLCVCALSFLCASLWSRSFTPLLYVFFCMIGFAQASVTVNTFPMVWEISRLGNVGKYTGYYYTCSMAAQTVTPILSGYLMQWFGYGVLFPYALIMVLAAIVPICFAKYGDTKPRKKKNTLEAFDVDDG